MHQKVELLLSSLTRTRPAVLCLTYLVIAVPEYFDLTWNHYLDSHLILDYFCLTLCACWLILSIVLCHCSMKPERKCLLGGGAHSCKKKKKKFVGQRCLATGGIKCIWLVKVLFGSWNFAPFLGALGHRGKTVHSPEEVALKCTGEKWNQCCAW